MKDPRPTDQVESRRGARHSRDVLPGLAATGARSRSRESQVNRFREEAVEQAKTHPQPHRQVGRLRARHQAQARHNQIQIQLPGKDPEKAKELLGTTAQLEFRIVDDETQPSIRCASSSRPAPGRRFRLLPQGSTVGVRGRRLPGGARAASPRREHARSSSAPSRTRRRRLGRESLSGRRGLPVRRARSTTGPTCSARRPSLYRRLHRPTRAPRSTTRNRAARSRLVQFRCARRAAVREAHERERRPPHGHRARRQGRDRAAHPGRDLDERADHARPGRSPQEMFEEANEIALVLKAGALPAPVTISRSARSARRLGPSSSRSGGTVAALSVSASCSSS